MTRILSLIGVVLVMGCSQSESRSQSESVGPMFGTFENCYTLGPNPRTCDSLGVSPDGSVVYSTGRTILKGSVSLDQIKRGSFSVSLSGFSVEQGREFQLTESFRWTNDGWVSGYTTYRRR